MKFEREATTKDGRRTWKVTYELVRGPEPKTRIETNKPESNDPPATAEIAEGKKRSPQNSQFKKSEPARIYNEKKKTKGKGAQLGLF